MRVQRILIALIASVLAPVWHGQGAGTTKARLILDSEVARAGQTKASRGVMTRQRARTVGRVLVEGGPGGFEFGHGARAAGGV